MKAQIQKEIDHYVELYDAVQTKTGNDDIAVVIFQEITKDTRMRYIQKSDDGLATERQKELLCDRGISFPDELTRKEASNLIEQVLQK